MKIKTTKYTGWVSKSYVTFKSTTSSNTASNVGKYYYITIASLNVREKASSSTSTAIIGTVKKGNEFKILKESGTWVQIQYTTTKKGWVSAKSVYGKISSKNILHKHQTQTNQMKKMKIQKLNRHRTLQSPKIQHLRNQLIRLKIMSFILNLQKQNISLYNLVT